MNENINVLLHTCCAPCLVKCQEVLKDEGFLPILYWYNPNIHPWTEYRSRKDALISYAKDKKLKLILKDEYDFKSFIRGIYPNLEHKRCEYCYKIRLEETAKYASFNDYKYFSTTLLISPYQNHELVKEICFKLAEKYSLKFVYKDFRPFFREGQKLARNEGLYMQKYCGCIFSEEERYLKK